MPKGTKSLTLEQFTESMKEIAENHRFYFWETSQGAKGRKIKYIYPSIDIRDGNVHVFYIEFVGMEGKRIFDERDGSESLYDQIKRWLNREDEQ